MTSDHEINDRHMERMLHCGAHTQVQRTVCLLPAALYNVAYSDLYNPERHCTALFARIWIWAEPLREDTNHWCWRRTHYVPVLIAVNEFHGNTWEGLCEAKEEFTVSSPQGCHSWTSPVCFTVCLYSVPAMHACLQMLQCQSSMRAPHVWFAAGIHLWNCVINCPQCKCYFITSGTWGYKQLHNQRCLGSSVSRPVSHNWATWIMRAHLVFVSARYAWCLSWHISRRCSVGEWVKRQLHKKDIQCFKWLSQIYLAVAQRFSSSLRYDLYIQQHKSVLWKVFDFLFHHEVF